MYAGRHVTVLSLGVSLSLSQSAWSRVKGKGHPKTGHESPEVE